MVEFKMEQLLKERSKLVDIELSRLVLDIKPLPLAQAVEYAISLRGKRIRPAVATLACEVVGEKPEKASFAAAAIELIHSASLVMDDIIDKSEKRRSKPTVYILWGNDLTMLVSEMLIALALKVISKDPKLLRPISNSLFYLGEGEAMEIVNKFRSTNDYFDLAFRKTGSLFGSAAEAGAIVGGGSEEEISNLLNFGKHLGIAFQIRDDILDCISSEEDLGKPVHKDLFMGRPSLVILDALHKGISLKKMMNCNNGELMDLISDSIKWASKVAKDQTNLAKSHAKNLNKGCARDRLFELCDYVISRSK
ncbi:MAG: polyprenyl synthetase family protein [Methanosarcinales archaeon]